MGQTDSLPAAAQELVALPPADTTFECVQFVCVRTGLAPVGLSRSEDLAVLSHPNSATAQESSRFKRNTRMAVPPTWLCSQGCPSYSCWRGLSSTGYCLQAQPMPKMHSLHNFSTYMTK